MIPKVLDQIDEADINTLIGTEETSRLDFKSELPKSDRESSQRFLTDICAFANTEGGDIVYGLEEDAQGLGARVVAQVINPDTEVMRLQSVVGDSIEPRLHGVRFRAVPLRAGGFVVVARVPRSSSGIHRLKRGGHFVVRESRSNKELDVPGIVSRISDLLGREDRARDFFARRYADVLTDQYPIPLHAGPKLVVHLVPSRDFLAGEQVDVFQFELNDVPYLHQPDSLTHHPCADGRIFWLDYDRSATVSTLLMHSGVIEGILNIDLGDSGLVHLPFVEESAIAFVHRARATARVTEILGLPFTARIALVGTQGMSLGSNDVYQRFHPKPVRQLAPVLVLPDTLIEEETEHVDAALHVALKRAWNAWGFESSPNYRLDDDSLWRRLRR
jgi:hypothetical protein